MRWIVLGVAYVYAQGGVAIGQWGIYAYHGYIQKIGYVAPYFWFLSGEGVCLMDGESGEYRELSQVRGLLYNRPTALYSDPYAGQIFLGYADGHIQYGSSPEFLEVIRDIAANPFYTSRAIRDFCARGDTLVVATDFGLVIWHKRFRRALATIAQFPGKPFAQPVKAVWWAAGHLWAFLEEGLYALAEGQPWTGPWQRVSRTGTVDSVRFFQGWAELPEGLIVASRERLFRWADTGWAAYTLPGPLGNKRVFSICGEGGGWAVAVDTTEVFFFGSNGAVRKIWNAKPHILWMTPTASHVAMGTSWIGGFALSPKLSLSTDAFQRLRSGSVTEVLPTPEGIFFLHDGAGFWGYGWGEVITFYPYGAQKGAAFKLTELVGQNPGGLTEAAWDGQQAWILNNSFILCLSPTAGSTQVFTSANAPFDGLFPDANGLPTVMRFTSIAIDRRGTVWVGKKFGNQNLLWYVPSLRRWYSMSRSEGVLSIKEDTRGYKWVLLEGGKILVIDDRGKPEEPMNMRTVLLEANTSLPGLPSAVIRALAPDRGGFVWLGTDKGVAVLAGDPFVGNLSVSLPVIENRYLLEEESITDIAVDGQNRKWVGTTSSGVYVLSSDGSRQLASYDSRNSPLPSNLIYRIRLWDLTGEVFIITSDGVVSYRDFATAPSEVLDTVYIFPNPVSRSFEGWVGIRGLSEGATVRIFTPDGQLVRYLRAFGGQAVWDLRTVQGEKVSPGVYLIGALDSEGRRSAIGKIVVTD
ncbi:MAG: hypothetical protein N2253_04875 [Bacteroidia bacterium]|nr:hypothetical protein [Bacteroidia bacterium]MCX7764209.1 hypothetical protein [Bacteroidia bacterium]MDW8058182.1 hypothetical protein [Bacteroidia bacterium]